MLLYVFVFLRTLFREPVAGGQVDTTRFGLTAGDGLGGQVSGRQTLLPDLAGLIHTEAADNHDNQEENQAGFILIKHDYIPSGEFLAKRLVRVLINIY